MLLPPSTIEAVASTQKILSSSFQKILSESLSQKNTDLSISLKRVISIRGGETIQLITSTSIATRTMDEWLLYSIASCFFYAIWTISTKLASQTIDSSSFQLIQLPIRIFITLLTAFQRRQPGSNISLGKIITHVGSLNLYGFVHTICACGATVMAGFFLGDALDKGGSGSAVAVITGCYPALSYVMSLIIGLESFNPMKIMGVMLAIGSCYCFAIAK